MAIQITPAGTGPVASTTASPQPVAARPAPRTGGESAPVVDSGTQAAAVAQVNQHLAQASPELKLQVDAGSGRTVFQVVQQGTGQVLLQVPSKEILGLSRRVREILSQNGGAGALVDKEG